MNDVRTRAKALYNALDFDKPIELGVQGLVADGLRADLYVERIHGEGDSDPVQELADQIDFSASAGTYLFTGNRFERRPTPQLR